MPCLAAASHDVERNAMRSAGRGEVDDMEMGMQDHDSQCGSTALIVASKVLCGPMLASNAAKLGLLPFLKR